MRLLIAGSSSTGRAVGAVWLTKVQVTCSFAPTTIVTYLACILRPQSRGLLAGIFWADKPDVVTKNNLRRVLPELRRHVGAHLISDRHTVTFDRRTSYRLDVEEFPAAMLLLRSSSLAATDIDALEAGLALYTGEFLAYRHSMVTAPW